MQSHIGIGTEVRCRLNGLVGTVTAYGHDNNSRVVSFPKRDTLTCQVRDLDVVEFAR